MNVETDRQTGREGQQREAEIHRDSEAVREAEIQRYRVICFLGEKKEGKRKEGKKIGHARRTQNKGDTTPTSYSAQQQCYFQ